MHALLSVVLVVYTVLYSPLLCLYNKSCVYILVLESLFKEQWTIAFLLSVAVVSGQIYLHTHLTTLPPPTRVLSLVYIGAGAGLEGVGFYRYRGGRSRGGGVLASPLNLYELQYLYIVCVSALRPLAFNCPPIFIQKSSAKQTHTHTLFYQFSNSLCHSLVSVGGQLVVATGYGMLHRVSWEGKFDASLQINLSLVPFTSDLHPDTRGGWAGRTQLP